MAVTDTSRRALAPDDPRIARALFTLRESVGYLGLPVSTLQVWARPKHAAPLITAFPAAGRSATVPFAEVEDVIRVALRVAP